MLTSVFKRCKQLLELFPEWRNNLQKVADKFPKWQPFVDNWQEIEMLFNEESKITTGHMPKTWKLMEKLRIKK
jgi:hypothetical protein